MPTLPRSGSIHSDFYELPSPVAIRRVSRRSQLFVCSTALSMRCSGWIGNRKAEARSKNRCLHLHVIAVGDHRSGNGSGTSVPRGGLFNSSAASSVGTHLRDGLCRNHTVGSKSRRDEQRQFHQQFRECPRPLFRKHSDRPSHGTGPALVSGGGDPERAGIQPWYLWVYAEYPAGPRRTICGSQQPASELQREPSRSRAANRPASAWLSRG